MTPQALHFATRGMEMPAAAPGPDHGWIIWLIILLAGAAAIVYPRSGK